MSAPAPTPTSARWENWLATLLLLAAAVWSGWAVTRAWHNGNLPGCEFRQAQTAVSAYWIQHDRDFSLAYPTPVLGKPWSIPMEFPLYQWTVVAVSDLTGAPLVQSARAVSLACLVFTLPAAWILLRRFGLPPARRALLVALVLTCPLLLFYARAFLIETMALMAALWFVAAFGETMHTRRFRWLCVANLAGAIAGPVKVTTFILYLVPAAIWGAWLLLRAWRERAGSWQPVRSTLAWGLGCVALPFVATFAWTDFADEVKAHSLGGAFLGSANMTGFNFGLGEIFGLRFSSEAWQQMFHYWNRGILAAPVALAAAAVAALFGGRWRWPALGSIALFFLAQFIFPLLYAWHEYYFVANAALLVLGAGFALCGLLEAPRARVVGWGLAGALLLAQGQLFVTSYLRPHLSYLSYGGTGLTELLRQMVDPEEVLVIAGEDWDSSTPFFARRRALMIRRNLESDWDYLDRAFRGLQGEQIGALLLTGEQRRNAKLLQMAAGQLGIDPRPALEHGGTAVYLHRDLIAEHATDPFRQAPFSGVTWHERLEPAQPPASLADREIDTAKLTGRNRLLFRGMTPQPFKFFSQFGSGRVPMGGKRVVTAHPLTRLWFHKPAGATRFTFSFGLAEGAYANPAEGTDGVEFRVSEIGTDGTLRQLYTRTLEPADAPADRGEIRATIPLEPGATSDLLLETGPGPGNNFSYDWAFLGDVEIR
ncbi:MAG TPA: hypothetical protein VK163_14100 [Opitutaceae bacterium]|nr:hypothetical protein [Opitutaceae bacterium]